MTVNSWDFVFSKETACCPVFVHFLPSPVHSSIKKGGKKSVGMLPAAKRRKARKKDTHKARLAACALRPEGPSRKSIGANCKVRRSFAPLRADGRVMNLRVR